MRTLCLGTLASLATFAAYGTYAALILTGCRGATASEPDPGALGTGGPGATPTPSPAPPARTVPPGYEPPPAPVNCTAAAGSLAALTPKNLKGQPTPLCQYQGKVLLVVNTASMCGYTPQLTPLQGLYDTFGPRGFAVLGFPSRSFNQEFEDGGDVSEFCTTEYRITFPLFEIGNVTQPDQQPVFAWLNAQPGMSDPVAWNFEKFLIGKDGKIAKRFLSTVTPDSEEVTGAIEAELVK